MSGFSFLSESNNVESVEINDLNIHPDLLLSGDHTTDHAITSLDQSDNLKIVSDRQAQDVDNVITLSRTAVTKPVKKKKRAPRVGFGRIDDDLDAEADVDVCKDATTTPLFGTECSDDNDGIEALGSVESFHLNGATTTSSTEHPTSMRATDEFQINISHVLDPAIVGSTDNCEEKMINPNGGMLSSPSSELVFASTIPASTAIHPLVTHDSGSLRATDINSGHHNAENFGEKMEAEDTAVEALPLATANRGVATVTTSTSMTPPPPTTGTTSDVIAALPRDASETIDPAPAAYAHIVSVHASLNEIEAVSVSVDESTEQIASAPAVTNTPQTQRQAHHDIKCSGEGEQPGVPSYEKEEVPETTDTSKAPERVSMSATDHSLTATSAATRAATSARSTSGASRAHQSAISCTSEETLKRKIMIEKLSSVEREMKEKETLLQETTEKIAELEKEQHRLAAVELYDEAAELGDEIEKLRHRITSTEDDLKQLRHSEQQLLADMAINRRTQLQLLDDILLSTSSVREERRTEIDQLVDDMSVRTAADERELVAERDRLRIDRSQLERESAVLEEEAANIDRAIQQQCEDANAAKQQVDAKLECLRGEIAELEKQLAIKRAEERALMDTQEAAVMQIEEVRRKFDRQLQRIREWRSSIEAMRRACEEEGEKVAAIEAEWISQCKYLESLHAERESVDKDMESEESLIRWTREQIQAIEELTGPAAHLNGAHDESNGSKDDGDSSALASMEESIRTLTAQIAAGKHARESLSANLADYTREVHDIEDRMPRMELEKKSFAASRQFREAAAVASLVKDAALRKDSLLLLIETTSSALVSSSNEITQQEETLMSLTQKFDSLKKSKALKKISSIKRNILSIERDCASLMHEFSPSYASEVATVCRLIIDTGLTELAANLDSIKRNTDCSQAEDEGVAITNNDDVATEDAQPTDDTSIGTEGNVDVPLSDSNITPRTSTDTAPAATVDISDDNAAEAVTASAPTEHKDAPPSTVPYDEFISTIRELQSALAGLTGEVDAAVEEEDYERAAALDDEKRVIQGEIKKIQEKLLGLGVEVSSIITD